MPHAYLEALEPRQLLSNSSPLWRIDGDLTGVATDDHIVIRASSNHPGRIEAVVNGVVVSSRSRKNLREVVIKSRQGDDRVDVRVGEADQRLLFRIYGGRGDDILTGGGERDILIGGSGADRLDAGKDHVRDIFYRDASDTLIRTRPDVSRTERPREAKPPAQIAAPQTGPAANLEQGIDRFAFDLYSVLAKKSAGKNLFFSPYSIATALGMLAAGSSESAATVASLLHRSDAELSSSFAQLLDRWQASPDVQRPYDLSIANAGWFGESSFVSDEYRHSLQSDFNAKIQRLNFAQNVDAANVINAWISEQTHQRITHLIDPGSLSSSTDFVLTNAIYFKGQWVNGFDKDLTRSRPFTLSAGTTKDVAMMQQSDVFNYFANDQLQLLELPYKGDDLSMVVLLPRKSDGLQQLGASLSAENVNHWLDQARRQEVHVYLPRFDMDNKFSLLDPLIQLGLDTQVSATDAISEIIHQANIEVNEEGTVAAAATGIVVGITCVCPPPTPPTFSADHPFVYAIRDRKTGGLLFLGQETTPPDAPVDMLKGPAVGSSDGFDGGMILVPLHPIVGFAVRTMVREANATLL